MKNSEYLKLMLCIYGYTEDISIEQETKGVGFVTYEVHAYNPEIDDEFSNWGESFQHILSLMCLHFNNMGVKPTFFWVDFPVKSIIDDDTRSEILKKEQERKEKLNKWFEETRWVSELSEKYNPCPNCKLNTHSHPDSIHYNCEECHTNRCPFMRKFYDIISNLYKIQGTINKMDYNPHYKEAYIEELEKIYKETSK